MCPVDVKLSRPNGPKARLRYVLNPVAVLWALTQFDEPVSFSEVAKALGLDLSAPGEGKSSIIRTLTDMSTSGAIKYHAKTASTNHKVLYSLRPEVRQYLSGADFATINYSEVVSLASSRRVA